MLLSNFKRLGAGEGSRYGEVYAADVLPDISKPEQTQRVAVKYSPTIITLTQKRNALDKDDRGESHSWTHEPLCKEAAFLTAIAKSKVGASIPHLPRLYWAGLSKYLGDGSQTVWNNSRLNQGFIPPPNPKYGVFTMVLQLCNGTLTDWMKQEHPQHEWFALILQMLVALTAIQEQELRICHSDCHMGNWLFIEQPETRVYRYLIEDEDGEHELYMRTRYIWQLADFGMAERVKTTRLALIHMQRDVDRSFDHAIGERTHKEIKQGLQDNTLSDKQCDQIYSASSRAALESASVDERYVPAWETLRRLLAEGDGRQLFTKKPIGKKSALVINQDTPFHLQVKKIVLDD